MWKALAILILALTAAGIGNICLSKGMQSLGPFAWEGVFPSLHYFAGGLSNGWVIGGILLELAYFALWLLLLSVAEVSWAVPMNAMEYIFVALLAQFWLGERLDSSRWIGIVLISAGVVLMMRSWRVPHGDEIVSNSAGQNLFPRGR